MQKDYSDKETIRTIGLEEYNEIGNEIIQESIRKRRAKL
jgi:hypothetical protein